MAMVVLFGLIAIPSLFTWFNVISSWDPFDCLGRVSESAVLMIG